jgi:hypothetical protein
MMQQVAGVAQGLGFAVTVTDSAADRECLTVGLC